MKIHAVADDLTPNKPTHSDIKVIKNIFPYLWNQGNGAARVRIVVALFLLLLAKVIAILVPILYQRSVDALDAQEAYYHLPFYFILAYGVARILTEGFSQLRDAIFARVGQRSVRLISLRIFKHLHTLSLKFHVDRRTGGLIRAIERGATAIEILLRFLTFHIFPVFIEIFLSCGVLWYSYGFKYAAIIFSILALYIMFTYFITHWRMKIIREMNVMDSKANSAIVESLLNYETVKYFNNETHEYGRYNSLAKSYETISTKARTSLAFLNTVQEFIISIGLIVIMVWAGKDVSIGAMTLGGFVLMNAYLLQLYRPLSFLGSSYREIKRALIDMEQMFNLLKIPPEIEDKENAKTLEASNGKVEFKNVAFSYNKDRKILRDISFTIPAGKTTAVVGASGAGKSTIARLLFRFYDVTGGDIFIDGVSIKDVTQDSLHHALAVVPQDTVLFNETIYYNINYGRPGASHDEIVEAAKAAQLHDFIMSLPQGYETTVGERGLKLSGGEKQRVAIARAFLKHPRIFIFDEATSALDSHTEKQIQKSLREVSKDYTTLIIAHRLSTIIDSDEILVLDQGEIVERGTHKKLLELKGRYAQMWEKQLQTL